MVPTPLGIIVPSTCKLGDTKIIPSLCAIPFWPMSECSRESKPYCTNVWFCHAVNLFILLKIAPHLLFTDIIPQNTFTLMQFHCSMGLGKTVQSIGLILLNPPAGRNGIKAYPYKMPRKSETVPPRCTIIVSPVSVMSNWQMGKKATFVRFPVMFFQYSCLTLSTLAYISQRFW